MQGLASLFGGGGGGSKEFGRSSADTSLIGRDSGGGGIDLMAIVTAGLALCIVALVVVFGVKLAREV